jgi:hypothetical protein
MMRRMFAEIGTEFIWWFDDDAYIAQFIALSHWVEHARASLSTTVVWGQAAACDCALACTNLPSAVSWVRNATWYRGLPPPSWKSGGKGEFDYLGKGLGDGRWFFILGGCFFVRTAAVRAINWPAERLLILGDDAFFGEAIRQQGWNWCNIGTPGVVVGNEPSRGLRKLKVRSRMSRYVSFWSQIMKHLDYSRFLVICGLGFCCSAFLLGQETPPQADASESRGVSTNEADAVACRAQLNIIYNALQKYIDEHQALPRWLSDLTPEYLKNPKLLVCPYVYKSGNVKNWWQGLKTFRVHDDPKPTSYSYEFCLEKVNGLPETTCREYKQRQMEIFGGAVPIIRCTVHSRPINLACDGTVYTSGEDWEHLFARSADDTNAVQAPLPDGEAKYIVRRLVRPRAANTNARCIDLSSNYNATLFHLSTVEYDGKVIEMITNGVYTVQGISFDVRGLVHLTAKNSAIPFPQAVEGGISLNQQCARIHLFHGTVGEAAEGAIVARYIFHLENGHKFQMPIRYGEDVQSRFFDPDDPHGPKESQPAWVSPPDRVGSSGHALRLYVNSWSNPESESIIQKVEFISEMTASAPFLVAVTTE